MSIANEIRVGMWLAFSWVQSMPDPGFRAWLKLIPLSLVKAGARLKRLIESGLGSKTFQAFAVRAIAKSGWIFEMGCVIAPP